MLLSLPRCVPLSHSGCASPSPLSLGIGDPKLCFYILPLVAQMCNVRIRAEDRAVAMTHMCTMQVRFCFRKYYREIYANPFPSPLQSPTKGHCARLPVCGRGASSLQAPRLQREGRRLKFICLISVLSIKWSWFFRLLFFFKILLFERGRLKDCWFFFLNDLGFFFVFFLFFLSQRVQNLKPSTVTGQTTELTQTWRPL